MKRQLAAAAAAAVLATGSPGAQRQPPPCADAREEPQARAVYCDDADGYWRAQLSRVYVCPPNGAIKVVPGP